MDLLVSDTSVLVDLERGNLLNEAFRLPYRLVVPDLLYERELRNHGGDELRALGLVVAELTAEQVEYARSCRREQPALSVPDVFALALAKGSLKPLKEPCSPVTVGSDLSPRRRACSVTDCCGCWTKCSSTKSQRNPFMPGYR